MSLTLLTSDHGPYALSGERVKEKESESHASRPSSRATTALRSFRGEPLAGRSLCLAGFPVELLSREHGSSLKKRGPDREFG
jgi:hypothetical protein